jgi:alginate O-acetyltransferase complex protein AlgI
MLFNSYTFIFLFLPVTLIGFGLIGAMNSSKASLAWIVACSMVFYTVWNPVNLALIMPSIAVNYVLAILIRRALDKGESGERTASLLLVAGIAANLCFLGYFKYKNFFVGSLNDVFGMQFEMAQVMLPLGISFITFQKIGFLVDVRARTVRDFSFADFSVFVFFFPQLIAGPIVHYREMMPQFEKLKLKLDSSNIAIGACLFSMGLFKKVILADGVAAYASPGFSAAAQGEALTFVTAWTSALAYTFQIYFDFSGYTDMALGLARMFGIVLPMNFNSPLKASSMIEFWSRWHITLTRFLTAYIYTPVVMALTRSRMRKGKPVIGRKSPRVSAFLALIAWPTVLTMMLSGLWHGAGVTFLVWGAMHGVLLVVNHAWRQWRPKWDPTRYDRLMGPVGFGLTFLAVVGTMVMFRADTVAAASRIYAGMSGLNGVVIPDVILHQMGAVGQTLRSLGVTSDVSSGSRFVLGTLWILGLFIVATCVPNTLEIMRNFDPALYFEILTGPKNPLRHAASRLQVLVLEWNSRWALLIAMGFVLGALGLNRASEFLYWQF